MATPVCPVPVLLVDVAGPARNPRTEKTEDALGPSRPRVKL